MNDSNPFDQHFQRHFVNHLLRDSSFLSHVSKDLSPDLFTDETLKRIVRLTLDFHEEHKAAPNTLAFRVLDSWLDRKLINSALHQSVSVLMDELFQLALQNKSYLVKEFDRFARQQMFKSKLIPMMDSVQKGDFDSAEATMKEIFTYRPAKRQDLGRRLASDPSERITRRHYEEKDRLWTLIPELDRVLDGLTAGEVGVWQSQRSSAGKSAALQFLARSFVFQGKKVLIYTLEMSEESYEDRLDMCIAGITKESLFDRQRLQSRLLKMFRGGGDLWIKGFPAGYTKIDDLRYHLDALRSVEGFHPDAILLDSGDLLGSEKEDLYGKGEETYTQFRGWNQEEGTVGWTASQSNRSAMESTYADQQHVGGSIAKVQIADVVISINRTSEEDRTGKTTLFIAKNRDGQARFPITIHTDFQRMAFWCRGPE